MRRNLSMLLISWKLKGFMCTKDYFFCIGILFFLGSCNTDHAVKWNKADDQEFEYAILEAVSDSTIDYGDRIWFHYELYNGDELVESSWGNEQAVELILPDKMHRNQFMEPLTFVGEGDSLWARIPYEKALEELSSFEGKFAKGDQAVFRYRVLKVESREAQKVAKQKIYAKEQGFASRTAMLKEQKAIQASAEERLQALQKYIKAYQNNELELEQGPRGLEYHLIKAGEGRSLNKGDSIYFYYQLAVLENGKVIDNLFKRGERSLLVLGATDKRIPAFQLALQEMKIGENACFFVPANLAYGEKGSLPLVPSEAKLVLDIEIVAVKADSSKAID